MTLTVRDVFRAMDGAWGIASRDAGALAKFDLSSRGFWKSFASAGIAAPFWFWFVLSQPAYLADLAAASSREFTLPPVNTFLAAEGAAYALGWILFPLMMIPIAKILKVERRYAAFITVHNWSMVLVYFLLAMPPVVLYNLGLIGLETKSLFNLTALFLELGYMWRVARIAFGVSAAPASIIVVFDVLLSILISLAAESFYAP